MRFIRNYILNVYALYVYLLICEWKLGAKLWNIESALIYGCCRFVAAGDADIMYDRRERCVAGKMRANFARCDRRQFMSYTR